jgi:hypothetical protein
MAATITAAIAASNVSWVDYNDKVLGTTTNPVYVTAQ